MIAHVRRSDHAVQSLQEHCANVARLSAERASSVGLEQTARLIGLLHDMGKATQAFKEYLLACSRGENPPSPHRHAATGALYAFKRWFRKDADRPTRTAAQIIILCVQGHHAGLNDCLDEFGSAKFLKQLETEEPRIQAPSAEAWFTQHLSNERELDELFEASREEVVRLFPELSGSQKLKSPLQAALGMTCRLLLSILIDADRLDSACFEYEEDPWTQQGPSPDWADLLETFETFRRERLNGDGELNRIRAELSDVCLEKAALPDKIVTLSIPTGGGKTFSSLRYALKRAALSDGKCRRIFYIIPYNTILDQNARDIREALANYPQILEHHSNVVKETESEQEAYLRLTERWDSHIILTSLVQFLNACYAAPNSDTRRFSSLTDSILIFDEIQSLPKHCKKLFERAVTFLSKYCGCTLVLCTATQPRLFEKTPPKELIPNKDELYTKLKRVQYIPELTPAQTYAAGAEKIADMLERYPVLTIVNTKAAAWRIYEEVVRLLSEKSIPLVSFDPDISGEEITRAANASPHEAILAVHMSTLLCPAHRKKLIAWIKSWLKAGRRVLCVSTALIEAGINVSFPVVVRSLTGLSSIVQAAGRSNRNMEYLEGKVYIWDFSEEKLDFLPDIQNGRNITGSILRGGISPDELDSPNIINRYFEREADYTKRKEEFLISSSDPDLTLTRMLGANEKRALAASGRRLAADLTLADLTLRQSFRTAYENFYVIEQKTTAVIVPWGEGKEIIAALNGRYDMREEINLLRRAQLYSVSVYESLLKRLNEQNALFPLAESGALALADGYYDDAGGVRTEQTPMELLEF